MRTLSRLLVAVALVLFALPVLAMTSSDLARLKKELGPQMSADLLRDLNAADLLPASKIHPGIPIWNRDEALRDGGSVAIVAPPAARVGLELQRLRERGVGFTDTPTVQRFLMLKDAWLRLVADPNYRGVVGSLDAMVRQHAKRFGENPNGAALDAVIQRKPDLIRGISLTENTVNALPGFWLAEAPKPGELQCFLLLYGTWSSAGVWCCSGDGNNCSVKTDCRPPGQ